MTVYAGEDAEQEKTPPLLMARQNNHFGNQYCGFSENLESTYLKTQKSTKDTQSYNKDICSTVFIAALFVKVKNPANNLHAPQPKNGKIKCGNLHTGILLNNKK